MKLILVALCASLMLAAQAQKSPASEEDDLRNGLGEAGSSPTEMIRALEKHLARYPNTKRRQEIERALVKAAIDAKDNGRILKYGEKYLSVDSTDLLVLERVSRILTTREDRDSNERGLKFAQLFEQGMRNLEKDKPATTRIDAQLREDLDRGVSRAYTFQARAQGHLGQIPAAVELAKKSFAAYPSAEPAREVALWLIQQGKEGEAIPYLADAFSLPDPRFTEEDRRALRKQMGELYTKLHNTEKGLGDVMLAAYDRAVVVDKQRRERMRSIDPNADLTNPMEFTLSGVNGERLDLKTLRGKIVVLDFWATWCGPCRVQYPMYETVKERFKGNKDVVFLGINTDQDREVVKPFLQDQKWNKAVYFEDGLSNLLRVSSIPATLIYGRSGDLYARMNGFVPERFVDMLAERIQEALKEK